MKNMFQRLEERAERARARSNKPMTRSRLQWLLAAHAFELAVIVFGVVVSPFAGAGGDVARAIVAVLGFFAFGTALVLLLHVREGRITVAKPDEDVVS